MLINTTILTEKRLESHHSDIALLHAWILTTVEVHCDKNIVKFEQAEGRE